MMPIAFADLHVARLFSNPLSGYLTVVSALLSVTGLVILQQRVSLKFGGMRTEGQIVGHQLRMITRPGQKSAYMPIVSFRHSGSSVQFQSTTGATPERLPVGTRVDVLYSPSNVKFAEIDDGLRIWVAPSSVIGLGAAALFTAFHAAG